MKFNIITIFPEMFCALEYGVIGRAQKEKIIELNYINPRDFSHDKQRRVDDRPYGGGPGMVMCAQPLHDAITNTKKRLFSTAKTIYLSPQGEPLTQQTVCQLSQQTDIILVAGRYEGVDERVLQMDIDMELSIGDYVLSGGELAAMVLIDAITRHLPGALGDETSALQDSFMDGLLDCPHYTRNELFYGQKVPNVLLSGAHKEIARWRLKQALGRTYLRRPDILQKRGLSPYEQELLDEFINENKKGVSHE